MSTDCSSRLVSRSLPVVLTPPLRLPFRKSPPLVTAVMEDSDDGEKERNKVSPPADSESDEPYCETQVNSGTVPHLPWRKS